MALQRRSGRRPINRVISNAGRSMAAGHVWFGSIRVAPKGSNASPNVRYAFNSDRICASRRTDAMCQQATYAAQQTARVKCPVP